MAKKRRGNGEGSIYKRKDGRWTGLIGIGHDSNGKRKRRYLYGKTRSEVQNRLTRLQNQKLDGTITDETRLTVAQYLDRWLKTSVKKSVRPSTHLCYKNTIDNHIKRHIGGVKLAKLTPMHVQTMYTDMSEKGKSPRTQELAHRVLKRALKQAQKWDLISRNVCDAVDTPRVEPKEINTLTSEQSKTLLKAAGPGRFHALFVLAITTGMRQGELFGLKWKDVDLKSQRLHIARQLVELRGKHSFSEPKTSHSRRCIDLSDVAVAALHDHRKLMLADGFAGTAL